MNDFQCDQDFSFYIIRPSIHHHFVFFLLLFFLLVQHVVIVSLTNAQEVSVKGDEKDGFSKDHEDVHLLWRRSVMLRDSPRTYSTMESSYLRSLSSAQPTKRHCSE